MTLAETQQQAETLHRLHAAGKPLVLTNAWDAVSARVIEEAGASAIATTSAGMAWSLGYADGERLPAEELLTACARIRRVVRLPLTVDLERGYGRNVEEVVHLVRALIALGVAGINIEDGREDGHLLPPEDLCARIVGIRALAAQSGVRLFVNARSDSYFAAKLDPAVRFEEALQRARRFAEAGADGIFIPGMDRIEDIGRFARAITLPFNVYAGYGGVPTVAALAAAGVRRVSLGCGPLQSALALIRRIAKEALSGGRIDAMTTDMLSNAELNGLFPPSAP